MKTSEEKLLKIVAYFKNEICETIDNNWDDAGIAEKGMTSDEAEIFLGHKCNDLSQAEIDEEVSEIQRLYYTEGDAELDELIEVFLKCVGQED